jgi:hypothetical protein
MIRHLTSIFCDDIRQEVGNKLSFMGCYTGQMFVHEFPLTLPKLCIAMHAVTPADNPFKQIKFRLLKGDEVVAEMDMNMTAIPLPPPPLVHSPGDELRFMLGQVFQLSPFLVTEPCVLRARAITEDEELKGGGLIIAVAPSLESVALSAPALPAEDVKISAAQQIRDKFSPYLGLPKKP